MKTKHVILRQIEAPKTGRPGGTLRGGGGFTAKPAGGESLKIEYDEITAPRAAEIARNKGIAAIAPVIPMKLIAPVATDKKPAATETAWGVKAVGADTSPFDGDGVIIAVLDTGIDADHPAFKGVNLIRRNFTTEVENDIHGHGTHCAGTIFGRDINGKRIGVAPGIKTALIGKILGEGGGGSDVVLEGIEWARQNGANIVSMSIGIDFPGYVRELTLQGIPVDLATSMALEGYRTNVHLFESLASMIKAFGEFRQSCLLIAAAGNESRRDENPDYEIAVSPPAVAEGIISVGALNNEQGGFSVAPFSNAGARVSAPGVMVLSAKAGGGLATMSGTSMATPHVAGVAALWAQKIKKSSTLTYTLFMDRLLGSATNAGMKAGFDPSDVGAGLIRAPQD